MSISPPLPPDSPPPPPPDPWMGATGASGASESLAGASRGRFALFRRGADPRHPPLGVDTYARLIARALTFHRDRDASDATVLWVPLAHVDALADALAHDGYALDLLCTDHNAAGGVAMGYVHVGRAGDGGMHQPMGA